MVISPGEESVCKKQGCLYLRHKTPEAVGPPRPMVTNSTSNAGLRNQHCALLGSVLQDVRYEFVSLGHMA